MDICKSLNKHLAIWIPSAHCTHTRPEPRSALARTIRVNNITRKVVSVCYFKYLVIKWGIHIRQGRKEEYVLCNLILMDVGNAVDTIGTDRPEHAVDNNDNTYLHIIKWLIAITDREKSASVWRASSSDWGLMLDQSIQQEPPIGYLPTWDDAMCLDFVVCRSGRLKSVPIEITNQWIVLPSICLWLCCAWIAFFRSIDRLTHLLIQYV